MSLRANDGLGIPKKPGRFSQVTIYNSQAVGAGNIAAFASAAVIGNLAEPVCRFFAGASNGNNFDGIVLKAQGLWLIELSGLYDASNGREYIVSTDNLTTSVIGDVPTEKRIIYSQTLAGLTIGGVGCYPANGGEVVNVVTNGSYANNGGAWLRATYLGS